MELGILGVCDTPPENLACATKERRLVTVLFSDLVGSTGLGESFDVEDVDELVSAAQRALAAEVEGHGGHVAKYLGDGLMALFGAPAAHEDDAERAALTALAMQRALAEVNEGRRLGMPELAMRIGITSGEVIASAAGGASDVSGDAANTAARLQGAADVGGVLVGEETMLLARRRIRFGEPRTLHLKGKAEPVVAYPVLGLHERVVERWETNTTPLVGREYELRRLLDLWERVRAGEGQLVTLVAEAGIGKSRLLAETTVAIGAGEETRVLRGRCLSYGQDLSLWLVTDLLRDLCGLREQDPPDDVRRRLDATLSTLLQREDAASQRAAADVLGELLGLPPGDSMVGAADAQVRRGVLVRSFRLLLTALAAPAPILVLLEDLHWADDASLTVLGEVLGDVPGLRMLVLASQRPGRLLPWAEWGWAERITLRPLSETETARLAMGTLRGRQLSPELERHVFDRAGGNPFFVEELLRALEEADELIEQDGHLELAPGAAERLPATLTEVLLARLDRLEMEVRQVAQIGSVLGRSFLLRLLARVAEQEETALEGRLRELQRAEVVFPRLGADPEYVFKHASLREVAYNTLLVRRRRTLHLAAARAIAALYPSDEYVEVIAYHYRETDEQREAAVWLERAGDRAAGAYANALAIDHYTGARERFAHSDDAEALSRVDEKLGDVRMLIGAYDEAAADFARARAGEGAAGRRVDLLRKEWVTWTWRGELDRALATFAQADAAMSDAAPPAVRAALEQSRSAAFSWRGDLDRAETAARRAIELLAAEPHHKIVGSAYNTLGNVALDRGELDVAAEHYRRALAIQERAGDELRVTTALGNLGLIAAKRGETLEAERLWRRSKDIVERIGSQLRLGIIAGNLGDNFRIRGAYAEAEEMARRALAIYERIGSQDGTASVLCTLGQVAHVRGRLREADEFLHRSMEIHERLGMRWGVLEAQVVRAQVVADRGEFASATALARAARRRAAQSEAYELAAVAAVTQARILLAAPNLTRRRRLLAEALLGYARRLAATHGLFHVSLLTVLSFGELHLRRSDPAGARRALDEALALARRGAMRREEGVARWLLGCCDAAAGDNTKAEGHLRDAMAILAEIGAELELARTKVALAELLSSRPRSDHDEAHILRAAARQTFAECGATLDLDHIARAPVPPSP